MTPAAKRGAVAHAIATFDVSQRRACKVIGAERSSMRYRHRRSDDGEARARLRALAAIRRRFGYRRLQILLRREGTHMRRTIARFEDDRRVIEDEWFAARAVRA